MASKRRLRRKVCNKVKYENETEAWKASRAAATRAAARIVYYRCKFCGSYHIGHPPKRVRQAIAQAARNKRER